MPFIGGGFSSCGLNEPLRWLAIRISFRISLSARGSSASLTRCFCIREPLSQRRRRRRRRYSKIFDNIAFDHLIRENSSIPNLSSLYSPSHRHEDFELKKRLDCYVTHVTRPEKFLDILHSDGSIVRVAGLGDSRSFQLPASRLVVTRWYNCRVRVPIIVGCSSRVRGHGTYTQSRYIYRK